MTSAPYLRLSWGGGKSDLREHSGRRRAYREEVIPPLSSVVLSVPCGGNPGSEDLLRPRSTQAPGPAQTGPSRKPLWSGQLARNAATAPNLAKQLASEEGVAELLRGGGKTIAGAGVTREIDEIARLVTQYGGEAGDWAKITGTATAHLQTHAYRNIVSGEVVELKSVIQ